MFGIADYGAFVAAIIIFLMIPGPGNLALITSTSKGGIPGGLAATLGVIAGDQVGDRLFKRPFFSQNTPRRALGHAPAWLLGAAPAR